jgi:hypothetical protein
MSKMKPTLAATFLTLILTVPALAGQIGSPGYTPPPPPPPEPALCESSSSDMDSTALISTELFDILVAVLSLI